MAELVFNIGGKSFLKELFATGKKDPAICGNCASCTDGECTNKKAQWYGWWINPKSLTGCNFHEWRGAKSE